MTLTLRSKLALDSRLIHLEDDICRRGLFDDLLCAEVDLAEARVRLAEGLRRGLLHLADRSNQARAMLLFFVKLGSPCHRLLVVQ